jgi:NAD(P)-dependent dehydrogenase (short-subunit alcohol dehydrogenase family)
VIIATASLAGIYPYPPDPIYSATKAGVVFFTQSLAGLMDEANIRVNCVCPGLVLTPLLEKARATVTEAEAREAAERIGAIPALTPEDIADAVVELVRDDSIAGRAMLIPNGQPRSLAPVPARIGLPASR